MMRAIFEHNGKIVHEGMVEEPLRLDVMLRIYAPLDTRRIVIESNDAQLLKEMGIADFATDPIPMPPAPLRFSLIGIKDGIAVYRRRD